ncbi:MAG: (E)-4-hydroxy-3-methylbut-2-enyl-diphosphate synthase [Candidatus Omnitrophica bacterium]|nr:(E)-4-hydroxy-3-methylbut-2-enyl-diphosphate synthase [Candidatus Omnitrophota bacterium]
MRKTRVIQVRDLKIGGNNPIAVQSMCATRTQDIDDTIAQVKLLEKAGADLIRIAIDNKSDVEALKTIRSTTDARLVVDLQENYPLAELVAPFVDKFRYNPGHLHHLHPKTPIRDKVKWLTQIARDHNCALRIGVNCGSVAPEFLEKYGNDHEKAIVESAVWHCDLMDEFKFENFVVSLKDSDPKQVVICNEEFSKRRPDIPIHLGVTEAGLPPDGIIKTRIAFEKLISQGIGDTLRVSLTVPYEEKYEEIRVGRQIIQDIQDGKFISVPENFGEGLNVISCPSCSRVENGEFVKLAQEVKAMAQFAKEHKITIAVMGCRVNGPGETDDADLGLWCGPAKVTLKKKDETLGAYRYNEILPILKQKLETLISERV